MPNAPSDKTLAPTEDSPPERDLEARLIETGETLLQGLSRAVAAVPDSRVGPQALARKLGVDKVLASRVLKTVRSGDPLAAIHRSPGPVPLRRVIRAIKDSGVDAGITQEAADAVARFERLIIDEVGDRSSLDAVLSAWVPEARKEFELRRKQSAFKAMSHLKGAQADTLMATVFIAPSERAGFLDIVWLNGLFGLHRLRPGAGVKFATRRIAAGQEDRNPLALDGQRVATHADLLLREFCSKPEAQLDVCTVNDAVLYTLRENGFGPQSATDIVFAEANRGEVIRYAQPGERKKTFVFAEVSTPSKVMQFDAFIHPEVFVGQEPSLRIYDTALEGVASPNDPTRDLDRLDMMESVESLGTGVTRCRSAGVGRYAQMLETVCNSLGWDGSIFRGHRCRIDYPIYGTQTVLMWDRPEGA